jgi:hypothetical protein
MVAPRASGLRYTYRQHVLALDLSSSSVDIVAWRIYWRNLSDGEVGHSRRLTELTAVSKADTFCWYSRSDTPVLCEVMPPGKETGNKRLQF